MNLETSPGEHRRFGPPALLWLSTVFAAIWGVGGVVDTRYHAHSGFEIESFLTLTHAMLYGGVTGLVLVIAAYLFEGWRLGERRRRWLPPGYPFVLGGALAFMAFGVLDALWHETFGFEVDLEALVSPTHVALVVARMVSMVGLLWAALEYRRGFIGVRRVVGRADIPAALAVAFLFGMVSWLLSYSQPFVIDYPAAEPSAADIHFVEGIDRDQFTARIAGTTGLFFHSALLSLFLVAMLRRLAMPVGAILIVMIYNGALQVFITDMWSYLPAVLLGALVGEAIWARLGGMRAEGARHGYWLLGAAVPFAQAAGYFGIMMLGGGIAWTIHLWAGAPFMAALYGLVAAAVLVPPAFVERLGVVRSPAAATESPQSPSEARSHRRPDAVGSS